MLQMRDRIKGNSTLGSENIEDSKVKRLYWTQSQVYSQMPIDLRLVQYAFVIAETQVRKVVGTF